MAEEQDHDPTDDGAAEAAAGSVDAAGNVDAGASTGARGSDGDEPWQQSSWSASSGWSPGNGWKPTTRWTPATAWTPEGAAARVAWQPTDAGLGDDVSSETGDDAADRPDDEPVRAPSQNDVESPVHVGSTEHLLRNEVEIRLKRARDRAVAKEEQALAKIAGHAPKRLRARQHESSEAVDPIDIPSAATSRRGRRAQRTKPRSKARWIFWGGLFTLVWVNLDRIFQAVEDVINGASGTY